MNTFFIQHIDDFISIGFGIWIAVFSWRQRERLRASQKKLVRLLPVLAPLVVVFSLLHFALDLRPSYVWQRASTSDKRASVEFPCATTNETVTDTLQGVSMQRQTLNCNLPQRDINLRLSYSEVSPEAASLSVEQRVESLKKFLQQKGFTVTSCEPDGHGDTPGYRIVYEGDHGKIQCLMRIVITPKAIYRVLATSASGFHDDSAISHFINSFNFQ
ncbi:MAG: hypothetical protein WCK57_14215 [Verrucomicrobiae bacterium]